MHDPNLVLSKADGGIALAAFPVRGGIYLHVPDGAIIEGDHLETFASTVADAVDKERERIEREGTPPAAVAAMRQCPSCRGTGKLKAMGAEAQECPVCDGVGKVD